MNIVPHVHGIDTEIAGDAATVDDVARWLTALGKSANSAHMWLSSARAGSELGWEGLAGDAYRSFAEKLLKAISDYADTTSDAADIIGTFGDELYWQQRRMSEYRARAVDGGLVVKGFVIEQPAPPVDVPALSPYATVAERAAHHGLLAAAEAAAQRQRLYEELAADAAHTRSSYEWWVEQYLVPMQERAYELDLTSTLRDITADFATSLGENLFAVRAAELHAGAEAAIKAAMEKGMPPHLAQRLRVPGRFLSNADDALAMSKWIKGAGIAITIGFIGADIAAGDSPSGAVLSGTAGMAAAAAAVPAVASITSGIASFVLGGGAAGAAAIVSVAFPPVVLVFVGAGIAFAVRWAYEEYVPLRVRRAIDRGFYDVGRAMADLSTTASYEGLTPGHGSAYKEIFGDGNATR
ncbi:hypothetical protein [Schaalia suimastitidis]|uniref:hypothetical protein n=1 Tax=Schaalia suimastitidis TaxID=121163 RepID=UPI0004082591|nr:hypothetical protein [Schaalia suimastitidis]